MFGNLIESSSHRGEFRRRGSFLLFTTATYALLFVIAGVVSIYAYDARMEDRSLELVTMMPLVDLPVPAKPPAPQLPNKPINSAHPANNQDFHREIAMAAVDEPTKVPDKISTAANTNLPRPKGVPFKFGPDSDPGSGSSEPGNGGSVSGSSNVVVAIDTPPPPAVQPPAPKVVKRTTILNGSALSLPKPPYPQMAQQMGIHGSVNVQVLIDEDGKVISAKAVSGHPFLAREAQKAAFLARFGPTLIGDQPMKVSGVITYNFVLQR